MKLLSKDKFDKIKNLYLVHENGPYYNVDWKFNINKIDNFKRPTYIQAIYRDLYFKIYRDCNFENHKVEMLNQLLEVKFCQTWMKLKEFLKKEN